MGVRIPQFSLGLNSQSYNPFPLIPVDAAWMKGNPFNPLTVIAAKF